MGNDPIVDQQQIDEVHAYVNNAAFFGSLQDTTLEIHVISATRMSGDHVPIDDATVMVEIVECLTPIMQAVYPDIAHTPLTIEYPVVSTDSLPTQSWGVHLEDDDEGEGICLLVFTSANLPTDRATMDKLVNLLKQEEMFGNAEFTVASHENSVSW